MDMNREPDTTRDRDYFASDGFIRRLYVEDQSKGFIRNQHQAPKSADFWQKIYEHINDNYEGSRDSTKRLANQLKFNFAERDIYKLLEAVKSFELISTKFYGVVEVTPKDQNSLWEIGYTLRLAGGEKVRHCDLTRRGITRIFDMIKDLKTFYQNDLKPIDGYKDPEFGFS